MANMPGMWIYIKSPSRRQGRIVIWNKSGCTLFGDGVQPLFACPAGARITVRLARFPKALRSGTGSQAV